MRRWEFVSLVGGATANWPLGRARAEGDANDRLPRHHVAPLPILTRADEVIE
jgi:hypothetical protein